MASNKSTFHPIDFSEDIMIKVQLGDDIRLVFIHNEFITYDELLLAIKRIFNGKLTANDDFTIKLKDEDGDMVTVFDSKSLLYALQTNRVLKLQVFMNNLKNQEPLKSILKANKELLLGTKDTVGCVLDTFEVTDEGNNSNMSNPIKQEPVNIASPKIPTYNIHTNELDLLGNSNEECSKTSQQVNISVSMDLIQQDAVTQPTGINLHVINKSDDNNSDGENGDYDDDDDRSSPSNLNTNTDNAYQCDQCPRTFKFRSWYMNHKTTHSVVGIHQCDYCPRKFKRRDNLIRHSLSHFGGVNYDCTQCGQSFDLKFNLTTHIKMKHAQAILQCSKCEMKFKNPRNKRYHENVKHNMVYSFACPCGERFGAPNLLHRHRRKYEH